MCFLSFRFLRSSVCGSFVLCLFFFFFLAGDLLLIYWDRMMATCGCVLLLFGLQELVIPAFPVRLVNESGGRVLLQQLVTPTGWCGGMPSPFGKEGLLKNLCHA